MLSDLLYRWRALFRRKSMEAELDEELRAHLEHQVEKYVQSGLTREEATRRARLELGGLDQVKEECRDARGVSLVETLLQDVRHGLRVLRKNPGFTAVAVLTLALGIGANTAMFSVVNGVLLRPLPYPEPERIMQIARVSREQGTRASFSSRQFDFWRSHSDPFQCLTATTGVGFNLVGGTRPERVRVLRVSTGYFQVFGVQPTLGREFSAGENQPGGANVAILSHGLWVRDFASDPKVLGRTVVLDSASFTIIGVMPSGFESTSPVDLWTTIGQVASTIGSGTNYDVIGRLKPGVSRRQANAYFATLTKPFLQEFDPEEAKRISSQISIAVFPYNYMITSDLHMPLLILFGAVGFVLLIACVNVANLQLARTATRSREISIRIALGAGRLRMFRQLLTENVLLSLLGAVGGLLGAYWGLHSLLALTPTDLPHAQNIALDRWALGFTVLVAVLASIVFGMAPALRASRQDLHESLKESGGRAISPRNRLRSALVMAEVALSLVLLVGSGLLIATFANLLRTNPGFDPHNLLCLPIWTTGTQYKSGAQLSTFYESALGRIDAIPGVKSSAVVAAGSPLEQGGNDYVQVVGRKDSEGFSADYREITREYFNALGGRLLQGRFFTPADSAGAAKVIIINAAFAREHFPGLNPLGQNLTLENDTLEIVGVVSDVKSHLDEPAPSTMFVPMAQASYGIDQLFQAWFPTTVLVRTAVNPLGLSHAVEEALRQSEPNMPLGESRSMEEVLSRSIAYQRFLMTLMSVFAGLALVLAAVGIYGVMSYSVSERTHEMGIRMALGANRREVLWLVVSGGLRLTLAGVAFGMAASFGLARLLGGLLFGVKPADPATLIVVTLLLTAVALLASYIPARRATKVNPMVALRYE
ncbi:MAG: ABC transporter permease [Terriglobia bacterium]|jgi:predicted permease